MLGEIIRNASILIGYNVNYSLAIVKYRVTGSLIINYKVGSFNYRFRNCDTVVQMTCALCLCGS